MEWGRRRDGEGGGGQRIAAEQLSAQTKGLALILRGLVSSIENQTAAVNF